MHSVQCTGIILFLILSLCPFCFAQGETGAAQEVSTFSLVQYEDGGGTKWKLYGKSLEVEDARVVVGEIKAVAFGEKTSFKLKAREGTFDQEKYLIHLEDSVVVKTTDGVTLKTDSLYWDAENENVFTDLDVDIKKADFHVNGKGAFCDLEEETAELKKDVTAHIKSQAPDLLLTTNDQRPFDFAQGRRTTITCDGPLEINYKKNKATFKNNVKVADKEGEVFADRMDVYFGQDTRRVRCVVARGRVRIVNGESVTHSEKAIYLVEQGRVILPKQPKLVIQDESLKQ